MQNYHNVKKDGVTITNVGKPKIHRDYEIGDIIDDMKVLAIQGARYTGDNIHYEVECQKCHRKKVMCKSMLYMHKGTTHKACAHGLRKTVPRFHRIWQGMRQRTTNDHGRYYQWYKGKGIDSDFFVNFIDFYDLMYPSYIEACKTFGEDVVSLDRIDVSKGYEPLNLRWIPVNKQQGNTTRNKPFEAVSPTGEVFLSNNQCEFAREHNLSDKQVSACLSGRFKTHLGWTFKRIECNDYSKDD